jgi:uncharacterized protein (TIGR02996 family)
MSDEMIRAFLDRIRAEPDEEVHRLALADWLEENGQPERAELLRVQVRLTRLQEAPSWPQLKRREQELRDKLRRRARALQSSLEGKWQIELRWDGFLVARVLADRVDWAELTSKHWMWVVKLDVCAKVKLGEMLQGLASPRLSRVGHLDLSNSGLNDADIRELAGSPQVARITALELRVNEIGPGQAVALASSRYLAGLTILDLCSNWIGDQGAEALAGSPHLKRLTRLRLASNGISSRGAEALAASAGLSGLTHLDLSYNHIENAGAQALASSPYLGRLTHLAIAGDQRMGQQGELALWNRFGRRLVYQY